MNRLFTTFLLTVISVAAFSQQAFAELPAAEENSETATDTTQQAPSAVDMMMQQESQQSGDVVVMPAKEMQAGETLAIKLLDFPRRGMTMDKVKNEYGQPQSASVPVGEPPITRWTYSDRVVFFEHSKVIHVVAR